MTSSKKGPRVRLVPPRDNRERLVCPDCDFIAYENPRVIVGSVVTYDEKFLMCKRAIEPRKGFWTLPAGFMECGETAEEGAAREAYEEAEAKIEIIDLLAMYSLTHISQVQLMFRATLLSPDIAPGIESQEVGLYSYDDLPRDEFAFPSVHWALDQFHSVIGKETIVAFGNPAGQSAVIE